MTYQSRSAPRKQTNKAGIIKVGDKEYAVLLRDASKTGARLRVVGRIDLPDRFQLVSQMEKIDAECEIVWRRGADVGVRFRSQVRP